MGAACTALQVVPSNVPGALPTDVDLVINISIYTRAVTLRFDDEAAVAAWVGALNSRCDERVCRAMSEAAHAVTKDIVVDVIPAEQNKVCQCTTPSHSSCAFPKRNDVQSRYKLRSWLLRPALGPKGRFVSPHCTHL